jgi:hypothetical protein
VDGDGVVRVDEVTGVLSGAVRGAAAVGTGEVEERAWCAEGVRAGARAGIRGGVGPSVRVLPGAVVAVAFGAGAAEVRPGVGAGSVEIRRGPSSFSVK